MENFREYSAPYFDEENTFGQCKHPPLRSTNNALLYTGTYFLILYYLGEATPEDQKSFRELITACQVPGHRGLYYRHPGHNDIKQEHDDYIGVAAADYFLKVGVAKEITTFGREHDWIYDSLNPESKEIRFWHGRFGDVVPHYKNCAGERLGIFDAFTWALAIFVGAFRERSGTSGTILDWLKIVPMDGKYFICDLAILFWRWKMKKKFPLGMSDVFATYFQNDGGYDHPFSKATKGLL